MTTRYPMKYGPQTSLSGDAFSHAVNQLRLPLKVPEYKKTLVRIEQAVVRTHAITLATRPAISH